MFLKIHFCLSFTYFRIVNNWLYYQLTFLSDLYPFFSSRPWKSHQDQRIDLTAYHFSIHHCFHRNVCFLMPCKTFFDEIFLTLTSNHSIPSQTFSMFSMITSQWSSCQKKNCRVHTVWIDKIFDFLPQSSEHCYCDFLSKRSCRTAGVFAGFLQRFCRASVNWNQLKLTNCTSLQSAVLLKPVWI